MTSKTTTLTQQTGELERFPDYPPRDDMQNWLYLYDSSILTSLTIHFADEPNVTVASEVPVGPSLPVRDDARIPDLLVVRDGDRELMEEQRGYAIDSQGKAPDFVLEVASPTTGRVDYTDKRADYERFGISQNTGGLTRVAASTTMRRLPGTGWLTACMSPLSSTG